MKDPEDRQQDDQVRQPGGQQPRHSPAERQRKGAKGEHHAVAQEEWRRPRVHWAQRVEGRKAERDEHLPQVEAHAIGRDRHPAENAQLSQ